MNTRILTVLAIASSLVFTACGESSPPAAQSSVQQTPVAQGNLQSVPTEQTPAQQLAPKAPMLVPAPTVSAAPAAPAAPATPAAPAAPATPAASVSLSKSNTLTIQGFASQVSAGWKPSETTSTMRIAQFEVPPAGSDAGVVAAFFFPTGKGGSHEANIDRWASQFASADGKPVAPKISTQKQGGTEVTLVELKGTYARGVGMGPSGDAKPNQSLIVAMVETSSGRITLQMYGPSKTVAAQRDSFLKLANGFRPA